MTGTICGLVVAAAIRSALPERSSFHAIVRSRENRMQTSEFAGFDLNLLVVFEALERLPSGLNRKGRGFPTSSGSARVWRQHIVGGTVCRHRIRRI
jgi:hypothetical protein